MNRLYENVVSQRGANLVADTTSETDSAVADMEGFDEIQFEVELGDVDAAAVLTFAVKENTANSTSSPTPTAVALTAVKSGLGSVATGNLVITESSGNLDNKTIIISVQRAQLSKRYCFLAITATVESYEVNAINIRKVKARSLPVTQPSNVASIAV